jgi:hypothetical protein
VYRRRRDWGILCSAWFWLGLAWLTLDILPFRLYRYLLNPALRKPSLRSPEFAPESCGETVQRVRGAVCSMARIVPWRVVCFHEGIAAQQMLRRAGAPAVLHYGVARSVPGEMRAHVWVTCGGQSVVGGTGAPEVLKELAVFATKSA